MVYTCNRACLGYSFTESTSTNSTGLLSRSSGIDLRTSDRERMGVLMRTTSLSASMSAVTSLYETENDDGGKVQVNEKKRTIIREGGGLVI